MIKIVFIIDLSTIFFHSDFEISGDVALKVLPTSGAILEETLASTNKQTKAIATYFMLFF